MPVPADNLVEENTGVDFLAEANHSFDQEIATDLSKASIIFFDGVCGICNHFVDFVMKYDRKQVFLFAPLQGKTAKKLLKQSDIEDLNSIVLMKDGLFYRHSAAVVRMLWGMPFFWKIAGTCLWIIPGLLRDIGYRFVAKIRYRIFGKKSSCRLPSPEERARFLE